MTEIGAELPDFVLQAEDGRQVRLSDYRDRVVVIETGSISCPMYIQALSGMNEVRRNHPEVEFLVLYTREAHPGGRMPPFETIEQKFERAKRLKAEEPEHRTILVDGMAGEVHDLIGNMPNSTVVVGADGRIAFRAQWNDPQALDRALALIEAGQPADGIESVYRRPTPPTAICTFKRAGLVSLFDFFIGLPMILYHHWRYD